VSCNGLFSKDLWHSTDSSQRTCTTDTQSSQLHQANNETNKLRDSVRDNALNIWLPSQHCIRDELLRNCAQLGFERVQSTPTCE
jgi:hypothetical protein